ncbi:MAG: hypothetical protein Q9218_004637 [Villophora microphyllina]
MAEDAQVAAFAAQWAAQVAAIDTDFDAFKVEIALGPEAEALIVCIWILIIVYLPREQLLALLGQFIFMAGPSILYPDLEFHEALWRMMGPPTSTTCSKKAGFVSQTPGHVFGIEGFLNGYDRSQVAHGWLHMYQGSQ